MPFVKASADSSHLELIKQGKVRTLSAFVPDDDGAAILVVFMNPTRMGRLNKSGLSFNADMMISGSSRPKKYGKLYGNLAKGVFVHLCTKKSCGSFQHAVHLGEWAYLEEGEEMGAVIGGAGDPAEAEAAGRLLHALGPDGVKRVMGDDDEEEVGASHGSPVPDPKTKAGAVRFAIAGQSPGTPKSTGPLAPIVKWCNTHGIPEVAEALAFNGVRAVEEVALISDDQIKTLCAGMLMGTELRVKMAVKTLREKDAPAPAHEPGSGWVDIATGRELPQSAMRGSSAGGPEVLLVEEMGVGFVKTPDRSWVQVRKAPGTLSVPSFATAKSWPAGGAAPTAMGSNFVRAGPLQELSAGCRELLNQVEGSKAFETNLGTELGLPADSRDSLQPMRVANTAAPTMRPAVLDNHPRTPGGRILFGGGARAPAKPVPLAVPSMQAAAIAEEWTDYGKMSFTTAVRTATWRKTEHKEEAGKFARQLDVALASGQILAQEPAAEVTLRDLAALWYLDQHPSDQQTADLLRESSTARWGVPAELWREARDFRKLSQGIKSD